MTEIQEVAQAIYEKHGGLWPLSREVAAYIAINEAGDQGHTIVANLVHELMMLNPVTQRPKTAGPEADTDLITDLKAAAKTFRTYNDGSVVATADVREALLTIERAHNLLTTIHKVLDGKEWDSETCQFIANHLINLGIQVRDCEDETGLTAEQLQERYAEHDGGWGEHPRFGRRDWRSEVASETTQRGYWDWVVAQIEQEAND